MSPSETPGGITKRLDELYEFDREPVAESKLCRGMYFASSYAGEHIAATEFVIGALFVSWGANVFDVIVGLLIGNLLAVLSWTFVCAPIALRTRLTLYWYVHRVGGPFLAFIYNICNAVLYCILAGTMITVSASAVRLPFNIPAQTLWYPTDLRFVIIVLFVGAAITTLAILGFKRLAQFASVCSPWMVVMFVVGAIVMLPLLGKASGTGQVRSFQQFWQMADKVIWTGNKADVTAAKIGFWHVTAFAWICNLAMHLGLSDMAILRYAKKVRYGLYTSTGMFLGHYVAWICAGVLGAGVALALKTPLTEIDSGAVGYEAMGLAGAIAVVLSGWTTANPTLYKSGLAIQAVTPNWPRWKVTAAVGAITTIIACFPFVFKEMLNFVGLYGLLLMPVGAIVFTEHWVFPKIGLRRYWVSHQNKSLNWPALLSWTISIAFAMALWWTDTLHLFFLFIPVYFLSVILYIVLARLAGAKQGFSTEDVVTPTPQPYTSESYSDSADVPVDRNKAANVHHWFTGAIALITLLVCLWMAIHVFLSGMENYTANIAFFKKWLICLTLIYFIASTYWRIQRERQNNDKSRDNAASK